jgi:hypothetical protein
MPDHTQLVKTKEDAEGSLREIPGVHAVGIGRKSVNGTFTDELAIAVFVTKKKPLSELAPHEVVPSQINGIKTDVIERQKPRLMMAANPTNLQFARSANQLSGTFSGKNPPGAGIVVVLDYSVTSGASAPVQYVASKRTNSQDTQATIATALANEITNGASPITATATGAQVTLVPPGPGTTCAITFCGITAIDDKKYFDDHIRGGIQIQAGSAHAGFGTIGFLATTIANTIYPQGMVVAVTCEHVVGSPHDETTNLVATVNNSQITFSTSTAAAIPLNSLVKIEFDTTQVNPTITQDAFYATVTGDTPTGVATGVAAAITVAAVAGVSATASGAVVTVVLQNPAMMTMSCNTYGPIQADPDSALTARVAGSALTFTGSVDGDNYGIYTSASAGGAHPTCGVFVHPAKGDTLSSIATAIVKQFNDNLNPLLAPITVSPSANTVNFTHAQEVSCIIKSDSRVGQPDNSFGSTCSHCCSHRIGRVIDSMAHLDVAVVQLDAGQKWVPEIQDLGLVTGVRPLTTADISLNVVKRGRTLPISTAGRVDFLNVTGDIEDGSAFDRYYTNAIQITSLAPNNGPFVLPGDSGAAVLDSARAVVGIVFGSANLEGYVTPIDAINNAFAYLQLNLVPAPEAGHAPGDVRTVPSSTTAMVANEQERTAPAQPFIEKRLAQAEEEISATAEGAQYAELVKTHFAETQRLVNSNRRVATAWHRNGGPEIVNATLLMLQRDDEPMPESIDGRPFTDCLERMRRVFARYASPALAADLPRFAECMKSFAGLTYPQMLATLRLRNGE